jgi:hypothetical protein
MLLFSLLCLYGPWPSPQEEASGTRRGRGRGSSLLQQQPRSASAKAASQLPAKGDSLCCLVAARGGARNADVERAPVSLLHPTSGKLWYLRKSRHCLHIPLPQDLSGAGDTHCALA